MDYERALLAKTLQTRQLDKVVGRGIETQHFGDESCREVYDSAIEHWSKYKSAPSLKAIKEKHPKFSLEISEDSLEYVMDGFIKQVKRRQAIELGRDYMRQIDNPDAVEDIEIVALDMARSLMDVVPAPRAGRYSDMERRIERYLQKVDTDDKYGVTTGIPTFDDITLGIQPHELVSVAAYSNVGKSTFMQHQFFSAYMQGKTPMLVSLEMEQEALFRKWDTMAANVKYRALKALELGEGDLERWKRVAEKASKAKPEKDIIVVDDIRSCTPEKVLAETMRYKPDVVGVDFINVMQASRSHSQLWERMLYIAYELKHNARIMKIPVVVAAQGNRGSAKEGVELDNVANSIGIVQASDSMIALHRDEDDEIEKRMQVKLIKSRDSIRGVTTNLHWDLDKMEIRELKPTDMLKPREDKVAA